jgi:hypothetical protein
MLADGKARMARIEDVARRLWENDGHGEWPTDTTDRRTFPYIDRAAGILDAEKAFLKRSFSFGNSSVR